MSGIWRKDVASATPAVTGKLRASMVTMAIVYGTNSLIYGYRPLFQCKKCYIRKGGWSDGFLEIQQCIFYYCNIVWRRNSVVLGVILSSN